MRAALSLVVLLGACVVEESSAPPDHREQVNLDIETVERGSEVEADVCGLALELPGEDVCSLVCDPDAFRARLVDEGMHGGNCYQFRCDLGGGTVISVGMCLPTS